MDNEPSDHDDAALLARLNNLKKSDISFRSSSHLSASTSASHLGDTPEDLIARFERLHGRRTAGDEQDFVPQSITDENGPPSPTVEELLAQLGPEEQYTLSSAELKEADDLLAEAKRTLPEDDTQDREITHGSSAGSLNTSTMKSTEAIKIEQDEEAEAEDSLQRILDELDLERQEPASIVPSSQSDIAPTRQAPVLPDSFASLVFPSTPDLPPPSLALPSAPTAAPSSRKPKTRPTGFSDDEIDSWCIICCANAAVKCFGCEGDLYCWGCWREGHVGKDVGLEEKNHVWERTVKAKG